MIRDLTKVEKKLITRKAEVLGDVRTIVHVFAMAKACLRKLPSGTRTWSWCRWFHSQLEYLGTPEKCNMRCNKVQLGQSGRNEQ